MRCKLEKYTQPLELAIKNKASCVFPFSLPLHSCLGGHVIQLTGSWDGRYPDSTVTFWQNLLKRNTQHTSGFVWARNKYPLCLTLKLGVIYYISYQYSPWLIPDMSMLHTFLGVYQLISLQKISKERINVYWLSVCIFHYKKKISTVKEQNKQPNYKMGKKHEQVFCQRQRWQVRVWKKKNVQHHKPLRKCKLKSEWDIALYVLTLY